jgi:undecaprenyl-diphosphatase
VPPVRLLRQQPSSSSFPSGHSASAAAFATGVALQQPWLALPVGSLAAAVIYSRVHTGVHYPGDVAAGAAIGVGSALLLRRIWAMPPPRAGAAAAPTVPAPALPDGEGLVLVVNLAAGSAQEREITERVAADLPAASVVTVDPEDDVERCIADAAGRAKVLGVAGGDGTVNCAAGVALDRDLPLAVVPAGTLNHFAADLGLDDIDDVIDAVRRGQAVEVDVGCAETDDGDRPFVNTFSVGVYPDLVRHREKRERWLGKWLALTVALVEVLHRAEPLEAEFGGEQRRLWLLFAGNGHYEPDGFAPSWRPRLDDGKIDVRIVDANQPWARVRLVFAVMSGRLGRSRVYDEHVVDRLDLRFEDPVRSARDGEIEAPLRRVTLRSTARRLTVYRPEPR